MPLQPLRHLLPRCRSAPWARGRGASGRGAAASTTSGHRSRVSWAASTARAPQQATRAAPTRGFAGHAASLLSGQGSALWSVEGAQDRSAWGGCSHISKRRKGEGRKEGRGLECLRGRTATEELPNRAKTQSETARMIEKKDNWIGGAADEEWGAGKEDGWGRRGGNERPPGADGCKGAFQRTADSERNTLWGTATGTGGAAGEERGGRRGVGRVVDLLLGGPEAPPRRLGRADQDRGPEEHAAALGGCCFPSLHTTSKAHLPRQCYEYCLCNEGPSDIHHLD